MVQLLQWLWRGVDLLIVRGYYPQRGGAAVQLAYVVFIY
jgi:hypothetical protein